jgi:hypothetical protein
MVPVTFSTRAHLHATPGPSGSLAACAFSKACATVDSLRSAACDEFRPIAVTQPPLLHLRILKQRQDRVHRLVLAVCKE